MIHVSVVVSLLGMAALFLAGCHKAETATPVTQEQAGNLAAGVNRKPNTGAGGGGVPDMNDYPAPSGVKTGVMPGGKK